jgi:hypothetical protein
MVLPTVTNLKVAVAFGSAIEPPTSLLSSSRAVPLCLIPAARPQISAHGPVGMHALDPCLYD